MESANQIPFVSIPVTFAPGSKKAPIASTRPRVKCPCRNSKVDKKMSLFESQC